jgi:hypothetical protein
MLLCYKNHPYFKNNSLLRDNIFPGMFSGLLSIIYEKDKILKENSILIQKQNDYIKYLHLQLILYRR